MKKIKALLLLIGFLSVFHLEARILEVQQDSLKFSSIQDYFKKGNVRGHVRYFFMATDNADTLTDYYANAIGLGLGYETPVFHGFKLAASGFFMHNLASSRLDIPDPSSNQINRYELGLFDVNNPSNTLYMNKLEDLNIQFEHKGNRFIFGKQDVNNPFLNPQDGRMRPTYIDGLTFNLSRWKNWQFTGGYIYGISPRSTVRWYKIGQSIGLYPTGLNPNGKPSNYAGNVKSDFIAFASIKRNLGKNAHVEYWNLHIDGVSNTSLAQVTTSIPISKQREIYVSPAAQFIYQKTIGSGGNEDVNLSYAQAGAEAYIYSGRIELEKKKKWAINFNYTRISDDGRYLMPREWGKDPMFTFMPRERNEGYANVQAVTLNLIKIWGKSGFKSSLGLGDFSLPDTKDASRNKYAIPSYQQLNIDLRYKAKKMFEGFEIQLLIAHKANTGNTYSNPRFVINKVDMTNYNFVINYKF
jgi:hypothetical protein